MEEERRRFWYRERMCAHLKTEGNVLVSIEKLNIMAQGVPIRRSLQKLMQRVMLEQKSMRKRRRCRQIIHLSRFVWIKVSRRRKRMGDVILLCGIAALLVSSMTFATYLVS